MGLSVSPLEVQQDAVEDADGFLDVVPGHGFLHPVGQQGQVQAILSGNIPRAGQIDHDEVCHFRVEFDFVHGFYYTPIWETVKPSR